MKYLIVVLLLSGWQVNSQCLSSAEMLSRLATIENKAASNKEKVEELEQLQKLFLRCNKVKDSVYARIAHRLGFIYSLTGDLEKAINYTKEAISINSASSIHSERRFLANSYFNLSNFYDQLYLREECHRYLNNCITISTQYPDKYFIAFMAFERKAFAFFQTGDYQKSVETADKGILFAKKINDTLSPVPLLSQKAQALIQLDDIKEAEKNIQQAISVLQRTRSTTDKLATAYSIYASLSAKKRNAKAAINYYRRAFQLNKSIGNVEQCSRDLSDLGFFYDKQMNSQAKAIACYKEGMKIADGTNNAYVKAVLYINMGAAVERQKKYELSLFYFQSALNIIPINFYDTSIRSNPTEKMLRLSANDYFVSTLLSNKGETLLNLYKEKRENDLLKVALNTFQIADKSVDLMRWRQYGEQSKLFWREKTRKMYEKAIETCYLLNDPQKAYYFFEKSRAVLLNDKLSELGAKKFITLNDRIRDQKLRIKVFSLSQQLASFPENTDTYNTTKTELLSAQEEWEKFIKSLEEKYPVYYQYKYNSDVYAFSDIKNTLTQNKQSLIELFNADSVIYLLLISPSEEKLLKILFKDYSKVANEMMLLCSNASLINQNYQRYNLLAYQLYSKLFKPLEVPAGRVIISPDDHFIPFEALLSDATVPSSYLLKKYAFSYVYSMGLLVKSNQYKSLAKKTFLGIAPVNYNQSMKLPSLAGADASLNNIKHYFSSTRLLIKEDATKQQFLKNLSVYNVVQIYSHADADTFFRQPVLYLADSVININEIQSLDECSANLVVLSGCRTGTGRNAKGEGVFSLARGFMAAGVPSTITTLWQIDNRATYRLTETFYKYLSQGLPKDIALQQAKLEFLQTSKLNQLPYYWASSILLGNTDKVEIKKDISQTLYIGAATIIALLLPLAHLIRKKRRFENVGKK